METRRLGGSQDRVGRPARARALPEALTRALCGLALVACTKGDPAGDDRVVLEKVAEQDSRASHAMHEADAAMARHETEGALAAIERDAKPAIDEGLRLADTATMKTDWGKGKRDAIARVLRDRKDELPRYTEALKSDDPEKVLSALEAQAAIERRALAAVAGIAQGR